MLFLSQVHLRLSIIIYLFSTVSPSELTWGDSESLISQTFGRYDNDGTTSEGAGQMVIR